MRSIAGRLAAATIGLSAEEVALIVAVGLVLGTFPVCGCPTILCAAAALALRLNPAVLQLINQIATPAQFALLLPFSRVGAHVIGYHAGIAGGVAHAVAGWLCIAGPMGAAVYFVVVSLLRVRRIVLARRHASRGCHRAVRVFRIRPGCKLTWRGCEAARRYPAATGG